MPIITLISDRLQLRLAVSSDLNAIHELLSNPETDCFNALGIPENLQATANLILPQIQENQQEYPSNYTFIIEESKTGAFIGLLGFKLGSAKYNNAEIWYKLKVAYWGKGYATEAVLCIFDWGFNSLHLHRISAGCAIANIGSFKVLEKAGMIREGHSRQLIPLKTGWSDCYEYAILATDYKQNFIKL
jgi:ribosomal-protein-alanine N-acetyltransferase